MCHCTRMTRLLSAAWETSHHRCELDSKRIFHWTSSKGCRIQNKLKNQLYFYMPSVYTWNLVVKKQYNYYSTKTHLAINFTNYVQVLYTENFRTLINPRRQINGQVYNINGYPIFLRCQFLPSTCSMGSMQFE